MVAAGYFISESEERALLELKTKTERAILVGMGHRYLPGYHTEPFDAFEEIRLLAKTAGAEVVATLVQAREQVSPRYYIGSGKAEELRDLVEEFDASTVIFDHDLSPAQVANHEKLLDVKVIDRSGLILDIFALRARTSEAKTQVELAQLKHLLPRLTRQWTHLSRQVGGIGVRGPGETQLEVDRRRVRERIGHLSRKLEQIEKRGDISRRHRHSTFSVTLVGYTNVGKSTLFNRLSRAEAPVENKLFKTLDTMSRRISLEYLPEIILSDTVGFIRDLPHELIASFRSTLADVRDANLLLHVMDITNPEWEQQHDVVEGVLAEMQAGEIPVIPVFNKIDRIEDDALLEGVALRFPQAVFVSAHDGTGMPSLQQAITTAALGDKVIVTVDIGHDDGALMSELYRFGTIIETVQTGELLRITCALPAAVANRLHLSETEHI